MPEGDRFERNFRAGWRRAYRHARVGATAEELAHALTATVAKTLRDGNGIPSLGRIVEVVVDASSRLASDSSGAHEDAKLLIEAFSALDDIVRAADGHRLARIAADAAQSFLVEQGGDASYLGSSVVQARLCERVCWGLIDHNFWANARENLVAEGALASHEEARQWQQGIETVLKPGLGAIAARLMKHPDGKGLRAPSRIVRRETTGTLMQEDLLAGTGAGLTPVMRQR